MQQLFRLAALAPAVLCAAATAALEPGYTLDTLTVTTARYHAVVGQTYSLDAADIALANVQTTGDLLATDGMLTLQKSQQGGGSPTIRGFEASRVLLVIDNVPLNNLIYRSGHLQNVITVDQSMLSHAGILYGPASVSYGSGALGGVVVFETKNPELAPDKPLGYAGDAFMRYSSANNETTGHFNLSLGTHKFASLTSATYSRFGDLRCGHKRNPFMPDNDSYRHRLYKVERSQGEDVLVANDKAFLQPGSAYEQYDLLQKFVYRPDEAWTHKLNFQLSNSSDVPRYDRLTDMKGTKPKFAEWYYGPQFRLLAAYTAEATERFGADHASVTAYYQNVAESRHNRKLDDAWRGDRSERINVVGFTADWIKVLGKGTLHTGLDGALNFLRSWAEAVNVDDGSVRTLDTRYPDGVNYMHNIDLFATYERPLAPKWKLNAGLRAGYSWLYADFKSLEYFAFLERDIRSVTQNNFTYSASVGVNYLPNRDYKLGAVLSTGYYVPNIDDVGKVFDSQPGMVVVPNPKLKPEQALNLEVNLASVADEKLDWEVAAFATYLFDAITLMPYTLRGQTSMEYDGEMSTIYANANQKRAFLAGATANVRWRPLAGLEASATATYTYGQITRSLEGSMPLDHVPPLFGRAGVRYTLKGGYLFELYSLFNGSKPLSRYNLNGEDNIVYATTLGANGKGLPAWFTLNLKAVVPLRQGTSLQLGVENLLDTEYRTFGSGINAPGRNFIATLRTAF